MELMFSTGKNQWKDEYYVGINSIEQIDENQVQIVFDGILRKQFEEIRNVNSLESVLSITPHFFIINQDKYFLSNFFRPSRSRNFANKWFVLKTSNKQTSLSASHSVENIEIPELIQTPIHSIRYLGNEEDVNDNLKSFFSWRNFQRASTKKIEQHLKSILHDNTNHKLNVYDVGQGSLTAVVDDCNVPLFYFDLGGAWWLHRHTYPITLALCFSQTKTVILSHWDLDHVETARRIFYSPNSNQLNSITWIAPMQPLTPFYLRLAARMELSGRLLLWSGNHVNKINFWAGSLIKCNGINKNDSGLALVVNSPLNSIKQVLHPGDAAYMYIPGIDDLKIDGLVATHHGANFEINNAPIPGTNAGGSIAYSHGNCYGHPTQRSIAAHVAAGWTMRRDTYKVGHISFVTAASYKSVPCKPINCNLAVAQTFNRFGI